MGNAGGNGNPTPAAAAPISIMEFLHGPRRVLLEAPHAAAAARLSSWVRRVRLRTAGAEASSSSSPATGSEGRAQQGDEEEELRLHLTLAPPLPPARSRLLSAAWAWPLAFGSLSMQGRLPYMEDTVSLRPGFHTWVDGSPMHFFGVFDGHGGTHVSELCRDWMHEFLADELVREAASFLVRRELATAVCVGTTSSAGGAAWAEQQEEELAWRAALARAFRRVVAAAWPGEVPRVQNPEAWPNRLDEVARIQAVGSQVMYRRVRGILAMTRALGDKKLRPEVIAEPEIAITERTWDDQCLILASDGMWNVISNETACHVARQCLESGNSPRFDPSAASSSTAAATAATSGGGHGAEPRCFDAAWVLGRLALARETADNISVIVLDLRQREQ